MQNNITRKSLWAAGFALLVSIVLLIGTTFAWFTDSITNSGNKIQAGTLDVSLEEWDSTANGGSGGYVAVGEDPIFDYDKWEPGYTDFAAVKIANNGTLALKYELDIIADGATDLAEVIDVYYYDDGVITSNGDMPSNSTAITSGSNYVNLGTLDQVIAGGGSGVAKGKLAAGANDYAIIALHMQERAGNEYQGKSIGTTFDIVLKATQDTVEKDGFGNSEYDATAEYAVNVSNAEDLKEAIAAGKPVSLMNDIILDKYISVNGDVTIFGNGKTISSAQSRVLDISNLDEAATITLVGVDLKGPTMGEYTRGISLYNNTEKINVIMDNCSVSANYYALNVASANKDVELTIKNTTITGWCAFQTHSPNLKVTFENCTLKGINDKTHNEAGWNNFATIVINGYTDGNPDPNGAHDCELTFKDCRIEAQQTTGNRQLLLSVRAKNTTVNVENCTFYYNGEQIPSNLDAVAPYIGVTSQEIAESLAVNFK